MITAMNDVAGDRILGDPRGRDGRFDLAVGPTSMVYRAGWDEPSVQFDATMDDDGVEDEFLEYCLNCGGEVQRQEANPYQNFDGEDYDGAYLAVGYTPPESTPYGGFAAPKRMPTEPLVVIRGRTKILTGKPLIDKCCCEVRMLTKLRKAVGRKPTNRRRENRGSHPRNRVSVH